MYTTVSETKLAVVSCVGHIRPKGRGKPESYGRKIQRLKLKV